MFRLVVAVVAKTRKIDIELKNKLRVFELSTFLMYQLYLIKVIILFNFDI